MLIEREHLQALKEGFELAAVHYPKVNARSCVKVLTNFYSTPLPVGADLLKEALEKALDLSRFDVEAVRLLLAWTCRRKSDKHIRSLRKPTPYARGANQGA